MLQWPLNTDQGSKFWKIDRMVGADETFLLIKQSGKHCRRGKAFARGVVVQSAKFEKPAEGVYPGRIGVDGYCLQRSRSTDQKRGTSNDLSIDHCSLIFERSACANEIIYGGYPDNNRVSTDIGTGLSDPECELYYVRNRTYGSIPGTVLRQEPKSRKATGGATRVLQRDPIGYAGGVNLYEYVGGRADVAVDPEGNAPVPILGAPPGQPNWLQYAHTCQAATAGYGAACRSERKSCKGPAEPWACCAQGVSETTCLWIRFLAIAKDRVGGTITINHIPFPADPCLLGCINLCLYQHWSAKPPSPNWKPADATCGRCGSCNPKCCGDSVKAEQTQLSACALGCGNRCGTPQAGVAKLIQLQAQRVKLGVSLCC